MILSRCNSSILLSPKTDLCRTGLFALKERPTSQSLTASFLKSLLIPSQQRKSGYIARFIMSNSAGNIQSASELDTITLSVRAGGPTTSRHQLLIDIPGTRTISFRHEDESPTAVRVCKTAEEAFKDARHFARSLESWTKQWTEGHVLFRPIPRNCTVSARVVNEIQEETVKRLSSMNSPETREEESQEANTVSRLCDMLAGKPLPPPQETICLPKSFDDICISFGKAAHYSLRLEASEIYPGDLISTYIFQAPKYEELDSKFLPTLQVSSETGTKVHLTIYPPVLANTYTGVHVYTDKLLKICSAEIKNRLHSESMKALEDLKRRKPDALSLWGHISNEIFRKAYQPPCLGSEPGSGQVPALYPLRIYHRYLSNTSKLAGLRKSREDFCGESILSSQSGGHNPERTVRRDLYRRFFNVVRSSVLSWKENGLPITDDFTHRLTRATIDGQAGRLIREFKERNDGIKREEENPMESDLSGMVPSFRFFKSDRQSVENWLESQHGQRASQPSREILTGDGLSSVGVWVSIQSHSNEDEMVEERETLDDGLKAEPAMDAFVPFDEDSWQ